MRSFLRTKNNVLLDIPPELVLAATKEGVIVEENNSFDSPIFLSLIEEDRFSGDGCEIGTVKSVGSGVDKSEIDVGDVVLYKASHGYPIPRGHGRVKLYKVDFPYSIVAVIGKTSDSSGT